MTEIIWNNALLEPVLITYNRATQLEKTLSAFLSAGLSSMRLHVLDNASTDSTPDIVMAMQTRWPALQYHRNTYNIGGNANILRAIEISPSHYHWVIGDDDEWHLSDLTELMTVLEKQTADIIRLGWLASPVSRGQLQDSSTLIAEEIFLFASMSMISATIMRRALLIPYLPLAYANVGDAYPQLIPLFCAIEKKTVAIFTLNTDLLTHTPSTTPGYFCGDLEWYACWFRTSRFLSNKILRIQFLNEVTQYMCRHQKKPRSFLWLIQVLLYYKAYGLTQRTYLLSMLAYGTGWRLRLLLLLGIDILIPQRIAAWLKNTYTYLRRLPQKPLIVDRSRL